MNPAVLVFTRQLYYSGYQSLFAVFLSGSVVGLVFVVAFKSVFASTISVPALNILNVMVVRSLGVLLPSLIFCARSVTSMTTELRLMSLTGEIHSLHRLGISPFKYLILPRALAASFSLFFLYFYFLFSSLLSAFVVSGDDFSIPFLILSLSSVSPIELFIAACRSSFIGAVLVFWVCRLQSIECKSIPSVSRGVPVAVLQSLLIILFDNIEL